MPFQLALGKVAHVKVRDPAEGGPPQLGADAFNTEEAVDRIIETTLGNIEAYAAGAPRNGVTAIMPASTSPGGPT